jgi:peptidoglycan-associated lipoprotein
VRAELDRLLAAFSDEITDGEKFDLVYVPGKGTSVIKEGELKDTIPGLEFKRLLFGIWLSDKATVNEDLTQGMLEGKVTPEALAAKEQWIAKVKIEKEAAMAATKVASAAKAAEEAAMKAAAEAKAATAAMTTASAEKAKANTEKAAMKAAAEKEAAMKAAAAKAKAATEGKAVATAKVAEATSGMSISKDSFIKDDVFFGVNSASLNANAKKTLANKAKWMKSNPVASVVVEVYCDSRGSKAYNMALAKKRAKSVTDFMMLAGIDPSRIEMVVFGEVESADNQTAWANNRRAHFKIK